MPDLDAIVMPAAVAPPANAAAPARVPRRLVRRPPSTEVGQVDVSICIANWNCRDLLQNCLTSLLDQDQGVRVEVIVIDNASEDGAFEMVARDFPEVVLHGNPANFGFARANNQAAARARGRYLLFLNNDTLVPPGTLRHLTTYAEAHPEIGMLGPRLTDIHGYPQVSYRMRPTMATLLHRTSLLRWTGLLRGAYRRYRRRDFDPDVCRPVEVLMGAAIFMPRDVFFTCGQWDENYLFGGEDLDLSYQVNRRYPVVYHPGVEITHYGRVSTRQHIGFVSAHMAAGFARYLRKTGCSMPALALYKTVVLMDAPIQLVAKALQHLYRRSRGRGEAAEKSLLALRGAWHFLRHGLGTFLRA